MDTTLRDGEQTHNVSFAPAEKLHIARILLEKVNVNRVEIASARVSEGEAQGVQRITEWAKKSDNKNPKNDYLGRIEILGFVDEDKSVRWIKNQGGKVINLLTKGSMKHLTGQLRKTPETHRKDIATVIRIAGEEGVSVNVYLEDWSNGYRDSRQYVYDIIDFLRTQDIRRIMVPDTLGVMYPTEVYEAMADLTSRYPGIHFDFHPHNDYGLGTINVLEAIRAGAMGVHTTVNCLGERAGNASLAEVAANIKDHLGLKTQVMEKNLFLVSRVVETFSGKRVAHNAPVTGEDVFTQTAGIHADGDKKGGLYENALLPDRFGRKRSYALGKMAGKASIDNNLKDMGIELSDENRNKVLARIIDLGDQKKIVTPDDLPFIINDVLNIPEKNPVRFDHITITTGKGVTPICSLWLTYNGKQYKTTGSGDGGYDAFMNALTAWTQDAGFTIPELLDYEVRIPPGGQTSALVECKITWKKNTSNKEDFSMATFQTTGVDPDQTVAAINATEKMINIIK